MALKAWRVPVLGLLALAGTAWPAAGQSYFAVTSLTTNTVDLADQVRSGVQDSAANSYNITYNGVERRVTGLAANGQGYVAAQFGSVFARRNNGATTFPTINPNQAAAWNAVASVSGLNHTVNGRYFNTMDALFTSNNVFTGTENLFVNDDTGGGGGGGTNVVNNVERMDYVFAGGLTANASSAFAVFERGRGPGGGGANGGFRIAAITALSGTTVTGIGSTVVNITDNSYGSGDLVPTVDYDVFRYATGAGPDLNFINNVNIGPQGIAGALIPTTALVSAGTTIFGYVVFGEDVTATGAALLDFQNAAVYNDNSGFSNDADLVATGAILFVAVPEPATVGLAAAAGLSAAGWAWRRRRNRQLQAAEEAADAPGEDE